MITLSGIELALLIIVAWMLALGAGAILFGALRPRVTGRPLILFGLFSAAYGTRIAAGLSFMPSMPLMPAWMARDGRQALTYVVLLPLLLLVEQFVGRGWRGTMRATVWLQILYTVVGVAIAGIDNLNAAFQLLKPYIVLTIGTSAMANILYAAHRRHDLPRSLSFGFVLFWATVGIYNLGLIVGRPQYARVEIFGYVPFVVCLGYAVAVYVLETEARLLLVDREVAAAQRIQAAILPEALPTVPGLRVSARYQPMSTMAGDFYDAIHIDDRRLGLLIADALGHGLAASLIAAMVKVAFSAEVHDADDPGALLAGMNTMLVRPLGRDREFVTACYLAIDAAKGELTYARAGHPPPLVVQPDGQVRTLDDGGTILGKFPGIRYASYAVPLPPGSRVVLYTDGITEAMNGKGESFGTDRLVQRLAASQRDTPEQCTDAIVHAVRTWRGGAGLDDDITVIVIDHVLPVEAVVA